MHIYKLNKNESKNAGQFPKVPNSRLKTLLPDSGQPLKGFEQVLTLPKSVAS